MKLVLKYNEDIKLFSRAIDYDSIVAFVVQEYAIDPATLELSFLDEDNDNITILSNEDVEVMQAVFEGKEYVKISVQGQLKQMKEELVEVQEIKEVKVEEKVQEKIEEPAQVKVQEKTEEKVVEVVVIQDDKEIEVVNKSEKPMVVSGAKEEDEVVEVSKEEWKEHCSRKKEKMQAFLKETVATLVDQRIKALLPCLKEQILNQQKPKVEPVGLVHEGFECKGCLKSPIVGIRYECPECPQFNLCEACEAKIDHDHNLLKIKKLVEKKKEESNMGHCFMKWFGHGRGSSSSRDKCHRGGHHWFMRKCWGLSIMFGGKPEDYKEFINQNQSLRPRETFKKWAKVHNIPDEEFRQRFIDMRCQKLSSAFGKPAQEYKKFVEENYESKYRDLVQLLKEKGEKMEERKCWWGGKRFNFNEAEPEEKRCPLKEGMNSEVKPERAEKVEQVKKEEPKVEEEVVIVKKDSAEVTQQKGAIFIQMKEIFGDQHSSEYFKFIEAHFSEGPEAIIQGWIDNASKLKK